MGSLCEDSGRPLRLGCTTKTLEDLGSLGTPEAFGKSQGELRES